MKFIPILLCVLISGCTQFRNKSSDPSTIPTLTESTLSDSTFIRVKKERDSLKIVLALATAAQRDNKPLTVNQERYVYTVIEYIATVTIQIAPVNMTRDEERISVSSVEKMNIIDEDAKYMLLDKMEEKLKRAMLLTPIKIVRREVKIFSSYAEASKDHEEFNKTIATSPVY